MLSMDELNWSMAGHGTGLNRSPRMEGGSLDSGSTQK